MTNKTIASLSAATVPLVGTELVPIWYGTTTKKVAVADLRGGGGGLTPTAIKTAAYTAVANDLVRVNSTAAAFTVSLPYPATDGDIVAVLDVANKCGTNAVLLGVSGGNTIEGDATGLSLNISGASVSALFNATGTNWKVVSANALAV
jgi:hypothetical protein